MSEKSWGGIEGILCGLNREPPLQTRELMETVIANMASNTQNMKRPALLAEDGATFHGRIDQVESSRFRAECYAQLDARSHVQTEAPEYHLCFTKLEGEQWIERQAAVRGFAKWWLHPSSE
jgi:hypothetical protein